MGNDSTRPDGNRLAKERSPYLRQHAHNPVDWYPWGEEALERARAEDRPILLSVGYSACHWCHVMERESFDDPETAERMNRDFVNIKVDREERPDIDSIYMAAVQSLTGRGGWPMTVFLTPGGEPFYGGTYYPPEPRHGMPSFRQVLAAVADAWENRRDEVLEGAGRIRSSIEANVRGGDGGRAPAGPHLDERASGELLEGSVQSLRARFDPEHGGFGSAPKFPQPVTLEFLLGRYAATGDEEALRMVAHTLDRMAAGGMHDQFGGGFHRYSVDARWGVPHFEKMLYDNALLARAYLDAWRATGDEGYLRIARSTLDWVADDLGAPEGGFFSARDADSEGVEGLFYLWTPDQVRAVADDVGLDREATERFLEMYDIRPGGNFPDDEAGRSIPMLRLDPADVASELGIDMEELEDRFAPLIRALLEVRAGREPPFLDTKVLCGWTAFATRAFAESGRAGRDDHLERAIRAARFVLGRMRVDGTLHRVFSHGEPRIPGFLEDHAALGNALLTLHETTLDPDWLPEVRWCVSEILERFRDEEGRFWDAPSDGEELVVRPRDVADTATPSGTSLTVELLLRAGHLMDEPEWTRAAHAVLSRERAGMTRWPGAFGRLLRQVERAAAEPVEIAILGPAGDAREALLEAAHDGLHPNRTVTGAEAAQGEDTPWPLLRGRDPEGAPRAWVCRGYSCDAPTRDPDEVRRSVGGR